jgi:signal-transduction protein with cAMP-binding, CBS, and nucleotidyltransferase domain
MAIDRLVAPLLRVPLLAGLRPLQITELARQAERAVFRRGDTIARAGEPADGAFLIVSGMAEHVVQAGREVSAEPVAPGSLVGEMAMLVEHDYRATVVARDRVLCLKITRTAVHAQMLDDPALARYFERHIAERLSRVADELREIDSVLAACGSQSAQPAGEEVPEVADSRAG